MLILDENNKVFTLESIHVPTSASHFWILDLQMLDYTLTPLEVLEELFCPSIALEICGFQFSVPTSWNILVVDDETSQLDLVTVKDLAGKPFDAMVYDHERNLPTGERIRVVDYTSEDHNVNPALNRHCMLCHPIGPTKWINIAPNDSYNKYLKNLLVGDIV